MTRIVVGYDGSTAAELALRWAADEAELRGAELQVVCAWHQPLPAEPLYYELEDELRSAMEEVAARACELVAKEHDRLAVRTTVTPAHPADALLSAADGADLLVVGSRGHHALAGLLMGSVCLHCVSHGPCPVVVVRPTDGR
jgi:nucleotide-binding universal stress UspA family protein